MIVTSDINAQITTGSLVLSLIELPLYLKETQDYGYSKTLSSAEVDRRAPR